jgi:hypothetical protein
MIMASHDHSNSWKFLLKPAFFLIVFLWYAVGFLTVNNLTIWTALGLVVFNIILAWAVKSCYISLSQRDLDKMTK